MQVKVSFDIRTFNDSFHSAESRIISPEYYPDFNLGDEFVKFIEHNTVLVSFESEDPNAALEIECYNNDGLSIVKPGQTIQITTGQDQDDMMVPGYHSVIIRTSDAYYEGYYHIIPSSISWDGLMNMKSYLENMLEGLSYNLYAQRYGAKGKNLMHTASYSQIYNHINENIGMLINNLNSITKCPLVNVGKQYSEKPGGYKRPDNKSQRWLSQKGTSRNDNLFCPDIVFEKHTVLNSNTVENKWIRKIIHHTVMVLCELEANFKTAGVSLEGRKQLKFEEYQAAKLEYSNKIEGDYTLSDNFRMNKRKRMERLKYEVQEFAENISYLTEIQCNIKKLRSFLSSTEYDTWLNEINGFEKVVKPSNGLLRDYRYSQLYTFYIELVSLEKDMHKEKKTSFPSKKTSKLFEYYTAGLVIEKLQQEGFNWDSGWLADDRKGVSYNGELPSETIMHFSRDNLLCEVAYDLEIGAKPCNAPVGRFVKNNARACRPDLRLSLFNKETNKLLKATIIEVKCRKTKYIYNEHGDTSVIEQLNDYYNFAYRSLNSKIISRNIIDNVIVIYPKQNRTVDYDGDYNFSFIQIDPAECGNECYGYSAFEEKIMEFLTLKDLN